ncbi:DUF3079 domain-containing protein [Stenoxybacter acetivorans]|uniref:DUF3079 domain-containing protein n=1 Tax=Stenoxybacter acetivorans TaxID=422441 RepID=UPI00055C7B46|nr:DUF3079 domain-containing protein [Stenoxybacter acetivorans]
MSKSFPLFPKHPERICWGCDKYCAEHDLQCGNGSIRIPHPIEDNGRDWYRSGDWSGLLSSQQQAAIQAATVQAAESSKPADSPNKPHIKLLLN